MTYWRGRSVTSAHSMSCWGCGRLISFSGSLPHPWGTFIIFNFVSKVAHLQKGAYNCSYHRGHLGLGVVDELQPSQRCPVHESFVTCGLTFSCLCLSLLIFCSGSNTHLGLIRECRWMPVIKPSLDLFIPRGQRAGYFSSSCLTPDTRLVLLDAVSEWAREFSS